ncbi:MAG: hypothetical protein FWF05_02930 [Oscillospiraceae bacterium]|nr:hypothetical protein [Oscillospiraceae bacterium]
MTELEKLQRAKSYIDKLANGIDPITDDVLDNDSALNNVRLSRCFFYVSDVLRRVIENGGEVQKKSRTQAGLPPFELPLEKREQIEIVDETMIRHMTERINGLVDLDTVKKLKETAFTAWLMEKGFLAEDIINGKKKKRPTEAGRQLGICTQQKEGQWGPYTATLYDQNAQRFLIDNLDDVIAISNGERSAAEE